MADRFDRRDFFRALGWCALLPAAMTHSLLRAQPLGGFDPPREPMRFTRRISRELKGGAWIDVVRNFEIRFFPQGSGYRVIGEQASCHVDAPPSLGTLAQLECSRREDGLFPMELDRSGLIVAGPHGHVEADMGAAVDEALAQIAQSQLKGTEQAYAREFVLGLQTVAAKISSSVPPHLFVGLAERLHEERELTLPDGSRGSVSLTFDAPADRPGTLVRHAERIVVTKVAGSERRAIEEWTLSPMAPAGR